MIITSEDLIKRLTDMWPDLKGFIYNADGTYWMPTFRDLEWLMVDTFFNEYGWTREIFDCDDFSLCLHAFVVQGRYKQMMEKKLTKEERLPWSFGQAWMTKYRGNIDGHAINICITRDKGMILIEPQSDMLLWEANNETDNCYYVRI